MKISVQDNGWRPIADAPKDGSWIIGFRGGEVEPVYVVMRWWDGILPADDDDLSSDEEGEWTGPEGRSTNAVSHWLPFTAHPDAPPPTTSFEDDDALLGIKHLSRADRGITQEEIDETRAAYDEMEAERDADTSRFYADFMADDVCENDDSTIQPGGHAA